MKEAIRLWSIFWQNRDETRQISVRMGPSRRGGGHTGLRRRFQSSKPTIAGNEVSTRGADGAAARGCMAPCDSHDDVWYLLEKSKHQGSSKVN